jgi:hypothetical protein
LKDYLHRTPVPENEKYWPSPEALARKILIKGKKLPTIEKSLKTLSTSKSAPISTQPDSISDCESSCDSGDECSPDSDDELSDNDSKDTPVLRRMSNTDALDRTESEQIKIPELSEDTKVKALGNNISIHSSLKSHQNSSTKVN